MALDKATVARIATLARIRGGEDELEPLAAELSGILAWGETICALRGRTLVVCPKSVGPNWVREAQRFIPGVKIALWRDNPGNIVPGGITVMNYSEVRISAKFVTAVDWFAAIIDEAQNIKNPGTKAAACARQIGAERRLAPRIG